MQKGKYRRIVCIILSVLLGLTVLTAVLIGISVQRSRNSFEKMCNAGTAVLAERFGLTETDAGGDAELSVSGQGEAKLRLYKLTSLGSLAVIESNKLFRQTVTLVLTPLEKNLPLLSMQYQFTPGSRTIRTGAYDLVPDPGAPEFQMALDIIGHISVNAKPLNNLPRGDAKPIDKMMTVRLRKSGTAKQDAVIHALFCDTLRSYADAADLSGILSPEEQAEKRKRTEEFIDSLTESGSDTADPFIQALGRENAAAFFRHICFGTQHSDT